MKDSAAADLLVLGSGNHQCASETKALHTSVFDIVLREDNSGWSPQSAALSVREMEEALRYHCEFEKLLLEISTEFINLDLMGVDAAISNALRRIARFAGVDLSYTFLLKENNAKMDITHWWAEDNFTPQFRLRDIPVTKYHWVMQQIINRETVDIEHPGKLPGAAAAERRFLEMLGVKSALIVPLIYAGSSIGLVGFAARTCARLFDKDEINLLKMVGHILASAMQYKRSQEALRSLESQMLNARKLESLGLLAGGIAHDFNNLLMSILGHASIAMRELPAASTARSSISRIECITHQAAELTSRLLAYAGKGRCCVEQLNLSDCAREIANLFSTVEARKHQFICNCAKDMPCIDGDLAQIHQLVMNLLTNAAEAIDGAGGIITLSTGVVSVDQQYLLNTYIREGMPEGAYVYLKVEDNGCGMSKDTLSRVFDPFFTTKSAGRGLGLAAVLGIVRAHRGTIQLKSEPGKGSVFTVLFPCLAEVFARKKMPSTALPAVKRGARILVVEDEEDVRAVVVDFLRHGGFEVVSAPDGRSALREFAKGKADFDAAVIDMIMPDMSGDEVCRELRRLKEDLLVIFTSGYSERDMAAYVRDQTRSSFVQKPYMPEVLIDKVSRMLDDGNSSSRNISPLSGM